ncbi:MAG: hypothetical protein E6Q39_02780 [Crocinitomicaceae bacterium]|nr:MAG: hypothetical protein E6Q39_02780 [Crocinitomicaceae bacterium]
MLHRELETEIDNIETEGLPQLEAIKRIIDVVKATMGQLRKHIKDCSFANEADEIHFFKNVKPKFTSKLIYYMRLYKLETTLPVGNVKLKKKILKKGFRDMQETFTRHQPFFQYYQSGATYLDSKYFLRSGQDIDLIPDPQYLVFDTVFHTAHEYLISELLAIEKLTEYLREELAKLQRKTLGISGNPAESKHQLTWTESRAALYELIYAVFSAGAVNNGNAEIKEIARVFGENFNVDVSQIYRAGQEIRIRKTGRTKFLNKLIKRVEERWDEQDENPRY